MDSEGQQIQVNKAWVYGQFGKPKVEVMAERARLIQPDCKVHPWHSLFTPLTADDILGTRYDGLVDAIDQTAMKALLANGCTDEGSTSFFIVRATGTTTRP